jgi:putative salt-induced outer membrane protein YdiY
MGPSLRALLVVTLVTLPAAAQDAPAPRPFKATIDLGFVNTAGNTDITSLNAGEQIEYTAARFTLTQTFAVVYARLEGTTNASQWKAGARGDYQVAGPVGVFVLGAFERNTFAGIARRFEEAVGLSAVILARAGNSLKAEAGVSLNQQTPVGAATVSFAAGRAAAMYRRDLTETAFFTVNGEFLPSFEVTDDYRINGEASLVAPISTRIATKLTYTVRFDNLPEPGFERTDRIFTAGLQITF